MLSCHVSRISDVTRWAQSANSGDLLWEDMSTVPSVGSSIVAKSHTGESIAPHGVSVSPSMHMFRMRSKVCIRHRCRNLPVWPLGSFSKQKSGLHKYLN